MSFAEWREQLFDDYARNLAAYMPQYAGQFACPLCNTLFEPSDLTGDRLTLEHCIPDATGGTIGTLTCAKCNNDLGSRVDAHLSRQLRVEDALQGRSAEPLRSRVETGEGWFSADMRLVPGEDLQIEIEMLRRFSNPKLFEKAKEEIQAGSGLAGKLDPRLRPLIHRARVALLKAGYLMMFRQFGYGYIGFSPAQKLREQILNPDAGIIPVETAIVHLDDHHVVNTVVLVVRPDALRCFLVTMKLSTQAGDRYFGVVLPGFDIPDKTYENWMSARAGSNEQKMEMLPVPFSRDRLIDPGQFGRPCDIWDTLNPPASWT
jgi:hypothetical protein